MDTLSAMSAVQGQPGHVDLSLALLALSLGVQAEVHLLEAKEASLGSAVRAMVASTLGEFSRQHTHSRDAHRAIKLHPRWSQTPLAQPVGCHAATLAHADSPTLAPPKACTFQDDIRFKLESPFCPSHQ